jgi:hypothetical protein
LHPEQVEVELCRAEELDRRRGLTSELDEMWNVGKKAGLCRKDAFWRQNLKMMC